MTLALLSASFQSLPPVPTIKLGPSGADSWVGGFVYVLGPCGSLQRALLWGWEFLPLLSQPPQVFSVRGLRLYFPELELWVAECVTRSTSHHFATSPLHPAAQSPPLLLVWINVSSLTPWLSDFHTVQFSGSSGCCFVFKFVVVLLLFVRGGTVHLPTPLSWVEVQSLLSLSLFYWC